MPAQPDFDPQSFRELALAVINQAVADATAKLPPNRENWARWDRERCEAASFLTCGSESFRVWCEAAGIDDAWAREQITKKLDAADRFLANAAITGGKIQPFSPECASNA